MRKYILQAILVSHIAAMALPAIIVNTGAVRSVRDVDADEATAYAETSVWRRGGAEADADEATAYAETSVWKRGGAGADADEATAYKPEVW